MTAFATPDSATLSNSGEPKLDHAAGPVSSCWTGHDRRSPDAAKFYLTTAADAPKGGHAHPNTTTCRYVRSRHVPTDFLDQLLHELHCVHIALVAKIRTDKNGRTIRVGLTLAMAGARRDAEGPTDDDTPGTDAGDIGPGGAT
ncbi:MAG TPA: hypothetical protein VFC00_18525 [Micromonosporaceae bacterium]|nr:hypothetical protein [Micromonosporaceae bacterium]